MIMRIGIVICSLLVHATVGGKAPEEPDPVFNTIDLNATYTAVERIFRRMKLTPKEMAVLIGGGHSSGQGSLEGGTYHGNWVQPMTRLGNAYFQLLYGHRNWCAVVSSDNGNAHFVAKGTASYIAETEYSPLVAHPDGQVKIPCVETAPGKAVYSDLPTVPAQELSYQSGTWHRPSGAAAFLPVDFALQYAEETYVHVGLWALDERLFFTDFMAAWAKMTEHGQSIRCPNVNGQPDFEYSAECAERFGTNETTYTATWNAIRADIKRWFDTLPPRCNSTRAGVSTSGHPENSVCPSSVFRLGFHLSATYDPEAGANIGGASFTSFLGPCALYDGCLGCLQDTVLSLQRIQLRYYERMNVSLADVSIYAAGMAAAYLAEFRLNHMPFHPGRSDPVKTDEAFCKELADRMPAPAYQRQPHAAGGASKASGREGLDGMLDSDVPREPDASKPRSGCPMLV